MFKYYGIIEELICLMNLIKISVYKMCICLYSGKYYVVF